VGEKGVNNWRALEPPSPLGWRSFDYRKKLLPAMEKNPSLETYFLEVLKSARKREEKA